MKPAIALVVGIVFFCVLYPRVSAQQAASATLSGRITDPNGAVVAGALVIATQKATGLKRQTTSNDQGLFVLTNLPADEYDVKIQASGFSERELKATLLVGQDPTFDATLSIASVAVVADTISGDQLAMIRTESFGSRWRNR